ncbi:zinc ribbon domain-containing protein [Robinsoniella sp. KNHs210]|uniref:zinc ribbon domain-containing protein n=1 Tax=Robinsoniella sp. KNHs210 TaxID=1469950 RepID=UPI00047F1F5F|nr:zinc ribbon domain-containing protein [Robinsoniella sp. KNHs210]
MYCNNCGSKIEEEWTSCPYCGENLIGKQEVRPMAQQQKVNDKKDEYVFLPSFYGSGREKLKFALHIITIIFGIWAGGMIISYIYSEIKADEGYKILLYMIRFLYACGPYLILGFIADELELLVKLQKNRIVNNYSCKVILLVECAYIIMVVLGGIFFLTPSLAEELALFAAVANDSIADVLITLKGPLVLLIIGGVVKYFFDERMLVNEKESVENNA